MNPFAQAPRWQRALRGAALPLSVAFHAALAWVIVNQRPPSAPDRAGEWVEMAVVEKPPPPPPPPPPPEPPPEPVDFKDTVPEPPPEVAPEVPPPPQKKNLPVALGMSATSFAEGSNTGFDVRAGHTTQAAATDKTLTIDEAANSVPYTAATTQPRQLGQPPLEVPESVKTAGLEGSVKVVIDIDAAGKVTDVRVVASLSPDADKACIDSWLTARFKPGMKGDTPVAITNFPRRCRFEAIE